MNGNEFPQPPKLEPDSEEEKNPNERQEGLSVSEIMEKIENGENVGGEDERKLREGIEKVILEDKPEIEWTAEENEMCVAYRRGVNEELFPESEKISEILNFDLESVRYNKSSEEEKREIVDGRIGDAQTGLGETEKKIIMDEYQDLEKRENKRIELKDELERINDEKMEIYRKINEEEINTKDIFSEKGREELKEAINALKKSDQALLNLRRFEYYPFTSDEFKSLIKKSHVEKDFEIRGLEKMAKSYDGIIDLLSKKEEEMTPEEKSMIGKMREWMKNNPKATWAIAILAFAGIMAVGWHFYGPAIMAKWGAEKVMEEAIVEVAKEGAVTGKGATGMGYLGKAMAGAGATLGAAGILGWLSTIKGKDIDDAVGKMLGVNVGHYGNDKEKS